MSRRSNESVSEIRYPGPWMLWLIWTLFGMLSYARHCLLDSASGRPANIVYELADWLTCYYPWIALAPIVFLLERKYPLGGARWPGNLTRLALWGIPLSYLGAQISQVLCILADASFRQPLDIPRSWWFPSGEIYVQLPLYGCVVVAGYVIRNLIQLREREREAAKLALEKAQLESSLRQAELETLRARLNPHFLFNSLQNIAVLAQEDPKTASRMLTRLGDLLRTALRGDSAPETTLASEIALTKSYIAVEQMRFSDRLTVLFDIATETEQAMVPTFLLQPLVENAILHGLQGVKCSGIISIRSMAESGSLVVTVIDNGIGLPVKDAADLQVGVGLSSTCERLARMYPRQHSFSLRDLPEGGTEVRVALPLRYENPASEAITHHEQTALADRR